MPNTKIDRTESN